MKTQTKSSYTPNRTDNHLESSVKDLCEYLDALDVYANGNAKTRDDLAPNNKNEENDEMPTMFVCSCGIVGQTAFRHAIKNFKGPIVYYVDTDAFPTVVADLERPTIDGYKRILFVPDAHTKPFSHVKHLCTISTATVFAAGRLTSSLASVFRIVRVFPDTQGFPTFGEMVARKDGYVPPEICFDQPADSAHRLVASGAPPATICNWLLSKGLDRRIRDEYKHETVAIVAKCELDMVTCKRNLILSKILEYYITQIAGLSSSE